MEPNPVIIAATAKQTASLIFLHGLGDTGHGWASTIAAIRGPHVKVICPTASTMPVTLNAGFRMPSWFDLRTLDATAPEDEEGIIRATNLVHGLITSELKAGVPANRILLGGFSQGGALALHAALTYTVPLAGVMALSCWLPRHAHFPACVKSSTDLPLKHITSKWSVAPIVSVKIQLLIGDFGGANSMHVHTVEGERVMLLDVIVLAKEVTVYSGSDVKLLPFIRRYVEAHTVSSEDLVYALLSIFQAHGDCDPVVPFKWGQMTASFLKTFMKSIEFNTYQGLTHSSSESELKDMRVFIERILPAMP